MHNKLMEIPRRIWRFQPKTTTKRRFLKMRAVKNGRVALLSLNSVILSFQDIPAGRVRSLQYISLHPGTDQAWTRSIRANIHVLLKHWPARPPICLQLSVPNLRKGICIYSGWRFGRPSPLWSPKYWVCGRTKWVPYTIRTSSYLKRVYTVTYQLAKHFFNET